MKSIKFAALTVCAAFAMVFASCDDDNDPSIKFNPSVATVTVDETQKVLMGGGDGTYTAKSSDEKTATVTVTKDTVFVKGVKAGQTTIVVTDSKNVTGTLNVKVVDVLALAKTETSLAVGKSEEVKISGGTSPYTATSADTKVAMVAVKDAQLTVTGVAAGSTTITVTDKNKKTVTLKVTVTK